MVTFKTAVAAFKAAHLFNPHRLVDLQPDSNAVDSVATFYISEQWKYLIKSALPQYLAHATDISQKIDCRSGVIKMPPRSSLLV